jgi:hypothetical protein
MGAPERLEYVTTVDDVLEFQHFLLERRMREQRFVLKRMLFAPVFVFSLWFALLAIVYAIEGHLIRGFVWDTFRFMVGLAFVGALAQGPGVRWYHHHAIEGLRRRPERLRHSLGPWVLTIADGWLREGNGRTEHAVRIDAIEDVQVTPNLILIFLPPVSAFIVPERAFPDAAALDAFVRALGARRSAP